MDRHVGASQYVVPSGLTYTSKMLPHSPYASLSGGRVTAWRPGHWANWQFELNASVPSSDAAVIDARPSSACSSFPDSDATGGNDVSHEDNVARYMWINDACHTHRAQAE